MITHEELINMLPRHKRSLLTSDFVDKINEIAQNPEYGDEFKQNMITYMEVLNGGKYSLNDYKNAILFVTQKLLGASDIDAYARTFPERYQRLLDEGLDRDRMSPYVTAYKRSNKLVQSVIEATLIPTHILNAHIYQESVNRNRELMMHARSETVQQKAATDLMLHLAPPQAAKLEVDIGIKREDVVNDYERAIAMLAEEKLKIIQSHGRTKEIANFTIRREEDQS